MPQQAPDPHPVPLRMRWRRVRPYFADLKWAALLALLGTLISAATEPAIPALLKYLLDQGFGQQHLALWTVPAMLLGLFAVRGLGHFVSQYALSYMANSMVMAMRQHMFAKLLHADMALFGEQNASSLANTVVYEVQSGAQQLVGALVQLTKNSLTVLALMVYLLYLNWQLTLIVLVMFPGLALIMKHLSRRLYRLTKDTQRATDALAYVVEENVLAHRMVRLHNAQAGQASRFAQLSQKLRRLGIKSAIAQSAMTPLTQMLSALSLSAVITVAIWQSRSSGATVGDFVGFVTAMLMIITPIRLLADVASPITRGLAAIERGLDLIDLRPDEPSGTLPLTAVRGALRFEGVRVQSPQQNRPALEAFDLSVAPGETVALVGASGAGKSTVAGLLPRFVPLASGQIYIDDQPIDRLDIGQLRAAVAMVSQDVVMLNDTLAVNVALGESPDEARVQAALEAAHLGEVVAQLPQGMHTLLGHNAQTLSGGQRQRLAIARAIYKNAPILILDEATSALDNTSERLVQAALNNLMRARTTLVIAHRLSTVEHADRVVVMAQGRVVEMGKHTELLAQGGVYAQLHRQGQAGT
mgnify:CR=1 FL=1